MDEILEYVKNNYKKKNDELLAVLEEILEKDIDNMKEEALKRICLAMGIAQGFTEYRVKQIAEITGLSRCAVKTITNQLVATNRIQLDKTSGITFMVPIFDEVNDEESIIIDEEEDELI